MIGSYRKLCASCPSSKQQPPDRATKPPNFDSSAKRKGTRIAGERVGDDTTKVFAYFRIDGAGVAWVRLGLDIVKVGFSIGKDGELEEDIARFERVAALVGESDDVALVILELMGVATQAWGDWGSVRLALGAVLADLEVTAGVVAREELGSEEKKDRHERRRGRKKRVKVGTFSLVSNGEGEAREDATARTR